MSETKHQMKLRHKNELKALQSQPAKGIGAKKKLKEDEEKLLTKHAEELRILEEKLNAVKIEENQDNKENTETAAAAAVVEEKKAEEPVVSRAAAKKAKKAEAEKARQAAVAEELKGVKDPRSEENAALDRQLKPIGKCVNAIVSDGHCMFRALADQLERRQWTGKGNAAWALYQASAAQTGKTDKPLYIALRHVCAAEMRLNRLNYLPYLSDDNGEPIEESAFPKYLEELLSEEKVMYGGHPELVALANALGRPITVFSAQGLPMAIEPAKEKSQWESEQPLDISFHRFFLGLGDHYNSVIPKEEETAFVGGEAETKQDTVESTA